MEGRALPTELHKGTKSAELCSETWESSVTRAEIDWQSAQLGFSTASFSESDHTQPLAEKLNKGGRRGLSGASIK